MNENGVYKVGDELLYNGERCVITNVRAIGLTLGTIYRYNVRKGDNTYFDVTDLDLCFYVGDSE